MLLRNPANHLSPIATFFFFFLESLDLECVKWSDYFFSPSSLSLSLYIYIFFLCSSRELTYIVNNNCVCPSNGDWTSSSGTVATWTGKSLGVVHKDFLVSSRILREKKLDRNQNVFTLFFGTAKQNKTKKKWKILFEML